MCITDSVDTAYACVFVAALLFTFPLFQSDRLGFSASEGSLILGLAAVSNGISAGVAGWLFDKYRRHFVGLQVGTVILGSVAVAMFILSDLYDRAIVYPAAFLVCQFVFEIIHYVYVVNFEVPITGEWSKVCHKLSQ